MKGDLKMKFKDYLKMDAEALASYIAELRTAAEKALKSYKVQEHHILSDLTERLTDRLSLIK
jgi:hypothetical protein